MNNNKGFTLIELMIVLGIIGIVISSLGMFLITNIRSFNEGVIKSEVQTNAQLAMDNLVNICLPTKGISNPSISNPEFFGGNLKNITLLNLDGTETTISYDAISKELKSNTGVNTRLLASDIEELVIQAISPTAPNRFDDCIGIKFNIVSSIKGHSVSITNEVYFRNKN